MRFALENKYITVKRTVFVHWDTLESQHIKRTAERIYTFKSAEDAKRVYSLLVNDTIESYDVLHNLVWEENITCTDWILW
jgi:hypothetical protein